MTQYFGFTGDPFRSLNIPLPANDLFSDLPLGSVRPTKTPEEYAASILAVARPLALHLKGESPITREQLQQLMNQEFGGKASDGVWRWKDAYEAQELALVMLLHMAKPIMQRMTPDQQLEYLRVKQNLCLTHSLRSDEQQNMQQFSTPLALGFLATSVAAGVRPGDLMLESSAGTGLLAVFGKLNGAQLLLNELAPNRRAILQRAFSESIITGYNGEQINDYLPTEIVPTVAVINPPFSRSPDIDKTRPEALFKHLRSALLRLAPNGRLVIISGESFSPTRSSWRERFVDLQEELCTVQGSYGVIGKAYYKMGTSFATRITVIDKVPAEHPRIFRDVDPNLLGSTELLAKLQQLSKRLETPSTTPLSKVAEPTTTTQPQTAKQIISVGQSESSTTHRKGRPKGSTNKAQSSSPYEAPRPDVQAKETHPIIEIEYRVIEIPVQSASGDDLFEIYKPKRIHIPGAIDHPTPLCESAAMASVSSPIPTYRPHLPVDVLEQGILSSAQLESVIYAGEAHSQHLTGTYLVSEEFDNLTPTLSSDPEGVKFRRGWFLGDGTGAGKGRQVAAIIADNFNKGRTKALWLSKSATLIEDAIRDWTAVGGDPSQIHNLGDWKLGEAIELPEGILFCTYSTLRSEKPTQKKGEDGEITGGSRLNQIINWLGGESLKEFDGVIAFDESHAMANAIETLTEDDDFTEGPKFIKSASQQGIKGLKLQNALPNARVLYVSATGATEVSNLAYASRLGLWGTRDFPFHERNDFITAIENGGYAAMEAVARDLKALGLYTSRSLSFAGVSYEVLEVSINKEQEEVYRRYADAFKVIHTNIDKALKATNVVSSTGRMQNRYAKMAANNAFEGMKQRFFNHLITAMKVPALIESMEEDLVQQRSPVVQIVTTNESIIKDRINRIPESERNDLNIDITPKEGILNYIMVSFPTQLYREYTDANGKTQSEAVFDANGKPIQSQEAVSIIDSLIQDLSLLPPMNGALEQILHHFGHDNVAEVTGRSIRILKDSSDGRFYVSKRIGSANSDETQSFMNGEKRIIVFSNAGGTGRSYHASLDSKNQCQRVHYILEAGWRADNAIQGLGRSHRTNQAHPPIFRVVTTDIHGEQRFTSTICRRVAELGALTRGQRQAGGQGIFDAQDDLQSRYAYKALTFFFEGLRKHGVRGYTVEDFQTDTGLKVTTDDGHLSLDLPSMSKFLNRILALPIDIQNMLFSEFRELHRGVIENAIAHGTYETGLETLKAHKFSLISQEVVYTHAATGSETLCSEISKTERTKIVNATYALKKYYDENGELLINDRSLNACVSFNTSSITNRHGTMEARKLLVRPTRDERITVADLENSYWRTASSEEEWLAAWNREVAEAPEFSESRIFLISGLLLPLWSKLEKTNRKVYRVQLDTGEWLLGRVVEPEQMPTIANAIGFKSKMSFTPSELYEAVFTNGQKIEIGSGFVLKRAIVQGENRIEVWGNLRAVIDQLKAAGCFSEMIYYQTRVFIPTEKQLAERIIQNMMELL